MTADLGTVITEINMLAEEVEYRIAEEIAANYYRDGPSVQHSAIASQATPEVGSISCRPIVGKVIVGRGAVTISGQVEGELRASTRRDRRRRANGGRRRRRRIDDRRHVKGTVHANRVKPNSTAAVEGDIFHRTLAIEENARFEGISRRNENTINTPSDVQKNRSHAKTVSIEDNPKGNGSSDGLHGQRSHTRHPQAAMNAPKGAHPCVWRRCTLTIQQRRKHSPDRHSGNF
jgi:hypothetical protein